MPCTWHLLVPSSWGWMTQTALGSVVSAFRCSFLLLFPCGIVTVGRDGPLMLSFWVNVVWGPCPPRTPVSSAQGPWELRSPWDTIHWLWDNGILSQVHVCFFFFSLFYLLCSRLMGLLESEVLQLLGVLRKSEPFISLNTVFHSLLSLCTPFRWILELFLVLFL